MERARASAKVEARDELHTQLREREMALTDRLTRANAEAERHTSERDALKQRIAELETPMGKGRAGEMDVASLLGEIGLHVQDTSMGEAKEQGYLDLLVTADATDDQPLRVAIELKNVMTVQKCDRDDFERKVRDGVATGKFEAAIFLSIRAHTKRNAHVALDMFPDDTGRALVPVTWIGPDRGRDVPPLTRECVETHVHMVLALARQCRALRRDFADGVRDADVELLKSHFDETGARLDEVIADLAQQQKLIDDLRANLTLARSRVVQLYASAWKTNREVPFLLRPSVNAPWMEAYNMSKERSETQDDAKVWNQCSSKKALVERTIGKEPMFQAIRQSKKQKT